MDVLGRLSVTSRTLVTGAGRELGDCREWILCTPNWIYHRMQNCRMAKLFFQMGHVPYTLWECIYLRSQECIERDKRGGNRQCIEFIVTRASCGRVVSRFDLICGDGRITGDGGQLWSQEAGWSEM